MRYSTDLTDKQWAIVRTHPQKRIYTKCKGGREYNCVVLERYRQDLEDFANRKIETGNIDTPMFGKFDKNTNTHWEWRGYAQELYQDLSTYNGDYYNSTRSTFIDDERLNKACSRYKGDIIKGYDKRIIAEVSQNISHVRLSVVLVSYMK